MRRFDIAPFALPNHPPNELRFEEPRDINRVVVSFSGAAPRRIGVSYLRKEWPHKRLELLEKVERERPARFGWTAIDDQFNSTWQKGAILVERIGERKVAIGFKGIRKEFAEFPGARAYDVTFRRTMGIRVEGSKTMRIERVQVFTESEPARTRLRVELDAGRRTRGRSLRLSGYNAVIGKVVGGPGARADGKSLRLLAGKKRRYFHIEVRHMSPAHRHCYDDGLVTFFLDEETFTISLTALEQEGPIWFAERGVYIARADDATSFAEYRARVKGGKTVAEQVREHSEQSFGGVKHCQPRPHAEAFCIGCKRARQQFWIEPNGDMVLHGHLLAMVPGKDTRRFLNDGTGRFFFGLERWCEAGRFNDPAPVLVYNLQFKRDDLMLGQKCLAVALGKSLLEGELAGDDTVVALVRFRLRNTGDRAAMAEVPVSYSNKSGRAHQALLMIAKGVRVQNEDMIPESPRDELEARDGRIMSRWHDKVVLRAAYETTMEPRRSGEGVVFCAEAQTGGVV